MATKKKMRSKLISSARKFFGTDIGTARIIATKRLDADKVITLFGQPSNKVDIHYDGDIVARWQWPNGAIWFSDTQSVNWPKK